MSDTSTALARDLEAKRVAQAKVLKLLLARAEKIRPYGKKQAFEFLIGVRAACEALGLSGEDALITEGSLWLMSVRNPLAEARDMLDSDYFKGVA
jgi:hypothetical protein